MASVGTNKLLTPAPSPTSHPELSLLHEAEATVNLLHMELFHHFIHATAPTLAFGYTWSEIIQLAFRVSHCVDRFAALMTSSHMPEPS